MDNFPYLELVKRLKRLTRKQRIYRLLKDELSLLGYWKNRQRGNPAKGMKVFRDRQEQD